MKHPDTAPATLECPRRKRRLTADHFRDLAIGRVDDHELLLHRREIVRCEGGNIARGLRRHRRRGDVARDHRAAGGAKSRRRTLVQGARMEVVPRRLLLCVGQGE